MSLKSLYFAFGQCVILLNCMLRNIASTTTRISVNTVMKAMYANESAVCYLNSSSKALRKYITSILLNVAYNVVCRMSLPCLYIIVKVVSLCYKKVDTCPDFTQSILWLRWTPYLRFELLMDVLDSIVDRYISCYYGIILAVCKSIKVRICLYATCILPVGFKNVHNSCSDRQ